MHICKNVVWGKILLEKISNQNRHEKIDFKAKVKSL